MLAKTAIVTDCTDLSHWRDAPAAAAVPDTAVPDTAAAVPDTAAAIATAAAVPDTAAAIAAASVPDGYASGANTTTSRP